MTVYRAAVNILVFLAGLTLGLTPFYCNTLKKGPANLPETTTRVDTFIKTVQVYYPKIKIDTVYRDTGTFKIISEGTTTDNLTGARLTIRAFGPCPVDSFKAFGFIPEKTIYSNTFERTTVPQTSGPRFKPIIGMTAGTGFLGPKLGVITPGGVGGVSYDPLTGRLLFDACFTISKK